MIKRHVAALLQRAGYEIHKVDPFLTPRSHLLGYDLEEQARRHIEIVRDHTMLTYPRLVTLHQQVAHCEKAQLEGSFVECGTWRGGAVGMMALGNLMYGSSRRHLHLFDSFAGVPEPDKTVDGERAIEYARRAGGGTGGRLVPLRDNYMSEAGLEISRHLLEVTIGYDPPYIHHHRGWFQEVLPVEAKGVGAIAILRLDGDWYASIKVCLDYLYDQVVKGGFIIIDDYGIYDGCRKATDEFLARQDPRPYLSHIDLEGRYWIKP